MLQASVTSPKKKQTGERSCRFLVADWSLADIWIFSWPLCWGTSGSSIHPSSILDLWLTNQCAEQNDIRRLVREKFSDIFAIFHAIRDWTRAEDRRRTKVSTPVPDLWLQQASSSWIRRSNWITFSSESHHDRSNNPPKNNDRPTDGQRSIKLSAEEQRSFQPSAEGQRSTYGWTTIH